MKIRQVQRAIWCAILVGGMLSGCGGSGGSTDTSTTSSSSTTSSTSTTTVDTSDVSTDACAGDTDIETVVCAVNAFLDTLSSDEQASVLYDWSDSTAKTTWSNLPGVSRNGLSFGDLDSDSLTAALTVAKAALSDDGYEDFIGVLAADDYLGSIRGGTTYSSDNYHIAFIGTPGVSNDWMLQIGGHHLAYNITYLSGTGYPVPNHIGVEPKASFEISSTTYAPLADEGDAMAAMFSALSDSELSYAYLDGESYSDVLVGPDNGSGVLPDDYPASSGGILVSDLSSDQQALVKLAIAQWVEDYASDVSTPLMAVYTSDAALAETYIAWAGTKSAGVDVDVAGTYMRIDGPRLWIEVACQSGVVISGLTHYHTMFRDKTMDYGNSL